MKQGSLASLMNSGNNVRRSVGSQGQATGAPQAAASARMQWPVRSRGLALHPGQAGEHARPRVCGGDPTHRGDVKRRGRTAARARRHDAPETRCDRGVGREVADAAARGLQGRALGHRHRVQEGPPLGQSGPPGLGRLDRPHRRGGRDSARRNADRRNAASGVQPGLPEGTRKPREPAVAR